MATQTKKSDNTSGNAASIQKMFNIQKTKAMKKFNLKKTIALAVIATAGFTGNVNAQWGGSGTTSGDIDRNGRVIIGPNGGTPISPAVYQLEVETSQPDDGIHVFSSNAAAGTPNLFLDNTLNGGFNWRLESDGSGVFKIHDFPITTSSPLFLLDGNTGNCTIGSFATTPQSNKLHIETSAAGDGIKIQHITGGDVTLFLDNGSGSTTDEWEINNDGADDFEIRNTGTPRLHITGAGTNAGNVGIGTTNPNARLQVERNGTLAGSFISQNNTTDNECLRVTSTGVSANITTRGLMATATGANQTNTDSYGVYGTAGSSLNNYGGYFLATGGNGVNVGVYGFLNSGGGASMNAAVYGDANGFTGTNQFAGYFKGNVEVTGTFFAVSDRKFKNNIKPITSALDNLMKLKPSSYNFKTQDFPTMSLSQGKHMGLIAQDLEQVFPDLVNEHTLPAKEGKAVAKVETYKSVNYLELIPVLIAAIQEQEQKITHLESQLAASQQKQTEATGIEQLNSDNANGFYMENVPNPYTTETTIKYTLPQSVNSVFLAVYDLSGKQLASYPVNKAETSLVISAKDLAAGIYLYSIIADGNVLGTKRMVVSGK